MFEVWLTVALRLGRGFWMTALAGGTRQRVTFFACAKKGNQRNHTRFAALRVPNFSDAVRAAALLGLRPQTVLADGPRTASEKLAVQTGIEQQPLPSPARPPCSRPVASQTVCFPFPFSRSRDFGPRPGVVGESCLSEASSFAARPCPEISGVRRMRGVLSLVNFLCTSKESNWPPGHPRPTAA
jgi:hypothetical protein